MATFRNESFELNMEGTFKKVASTLRDNEIPFCLIGSLAAWARGGPESSHDLDFGIREEDIIRAAEVLSAVGMRIEIPPEDWLIKAWDPPSERPGSKETLVDLIYAPSGMRVDDELLSRAIEMDVLAVRMPVLDATDLLIMKLLSLREQHLNYTSTIATARAVREQIDWQLLKERTKSSPYAAGFFVMCEQLGIAPNGDPENYTLETMQRFEGNRPLRPDLRRALTQMLDADGRFSVERARHLGAVLHDQDLMAQPWAKEGIERHESSRGERIRLTSDSEAEAKSARPGIVETPDGVYLDGLLDRGLQDSVREGISTSDGTSVVAIGRPMNDAERHQVRTELDMPLRYEQETVGLEPSRYLPMIYDLMVDLHGQEVAMQAAMSQRCAQDPALNQAMIKMINVGWMSSDTYMLTAAGQEQALRIKQAFASDFEDDEQ